MDFLSRLGSIFKAAQDVDRENFLYMKVWRDVIEDAVCVYAHPIASTEPSVLEHLTGGPPAFPVTVHDRSPDSHDVSGEFFNTSSSPEKEMASRKSLSHSLRFGKGTNAQHADLCQSRDPRDA